MSDPIDEPLRLGLIGLGRHSYDGLYNALRWTPGYDLTAVCDVDAGRRDRFCRLYRAGAAFADYTDMFATVELDAVCIQIGHEQNAPAIQAALEAGVDVFVEKTPVASSAEAYELLELQHSRGRFVMVGFNRRFMTGFLMAQEISRRPEFGGIQVFDSQFHAGAYRPGRLLINHLVHHLDLARWLLGELDIDDVRYRAVDDRRTAYLVNFTARDSGAIGSISSASLLDEHYPMERLELLGLGRNVIVDNITSVVYNRPVSAPTDTFEPFALRDGADALVWNLNHGYYPRFTYQGYENELRHFLTAVRNRVAPSPDLADAARTLELAEIVSERTRLR